MASRSGSTPSLFGRGEHQCLCREGFREDSRANEFPPRLPRRGTWSKPVVRQYDEHEPSLKFGILGEECATALDPAIPDSIIGGIRRISTCCNALLRVFPAFLQPSAPLLPSAKCRDQSIGDSESSQRFERPLGDDIPKVTTDAEVVLSRFPHNLQPDEFWKLSIRVTLLEKFGSQDSTSSNSC